MSPQTRLERYEHRAEWPLACLALVFLALYSVRVLGKPDVAAERAVAFALWAIFSVFIVDYIVRLKLAQPRGSRRSTRSAMPCGGR
jgi:voltage-gated potassium channel